MASAELVVHVTTRIRPWYQWPWFTMTRFGRCYRNYTAGPVWQRAIIAAYLANLTIQFDGKTVQ